MDLFLIHYLDDDALLAGLEARLSPSNLISSPLHVLFWVGILVLLVAAVIPLLPLPVVAPPSRSAPAAAGAEELCPIDGANKSPPVNSAAPCIATGCGAAATAVVVDDVNEPKSLAPDAPTGAAVNEPKLFCCGGVG